MHDVSNMSQDTGGETPLSLGLSCKRYGDHLRNKSLDNVRKKNALGSSRAREAGAKKGAEEQSPACGRAGGRRDEAARGATADGGMQPSSSRRGELRFGDLWEISERAT